MPTYTYQCQQCGDQFDTIRSISKMHEPEQEPCQSCNGEVKKIITPVNISYAGAPRVIPDWYNDKLKGLKKRYGNERTQIDNHIKR